MAISDGTERAPHRQQVDVLIGTVLRGESLGEVRLLPHARELLENYTRSSSDTPAQRAAAQSVLDHIDQAG